MPNKIHSIYFDEIDSTNLELKRMVESFVSEYTVVSAGSQTAGRGRRGRTWSSPHGESISTSMVLYPEKGVLSRISQITLISGVAVCRAIRNLYALSPKIKWPNDVLLDEKKVCGILAEHIISSEGKDVIIVGIGVNVNITDFPKDIQNTSTSIEQELKIGSKLKVSKSKLTNKIWEYFLDCYSDFKQNDYAAIIPTELDSLLINKGREVCIESEGNIISGECVGVNSSGELMVKSEEGILTVKYGEVSVRGIYGYV